MSADEPAAPRDDARLVKHSLVVAGHRTSISLEGIFWQALRDEAAARGLSVAGLVREVDEGRGATNLSSALRVHILRGLQATASLAGTKIPTQG